VRFVIYLCRNVFTVSYVCVAYVENLTVRRGEEVHMKCPSSKAVEWRHANFLIYSHGYIYLSGYTIHISPGENILLIVNATSAFAGVYKCFDADSEHPRKIFIIRVDEGNATLHIFIIHM